MTNPWDKLQQEESPSELNPLTNPVLERNLGRWAKVYFSTPPAKRAQAVSSLLQEIKRESGIAVAPEPDHPDLPLEAKAQGAVCSACQHQNPPGHKFCSRCGAGLTGEPLIPVPVPVKSAATETPGVSLVSEEQPHSSNEVPWLNPRTFSSLDVADATPRQRWKYLMGVAAVVLAGFLYLQWASGPRKTALTAAPQVTAPPAAPKENSSAVDERPTETVSPPSRPVEAPKPATEARDRTAVPAGLQPASQKTPLLNQNSRPATVQSEGGVSDLRLAQRYLGGSMGARDSSEAAKLLWKAVGKQNATAAVLLSDLYLRGDGVPRSCDQARLLLVAAAKQNSPQAAQQLRNLESQGCH